MCWGVGHVLLWKLRCRSTVPTRLPPVAQEDGGRELLINKEEAKDLFESMQGDALLLTVRSHSSSPRSLAPNSCRRPHSTPPIPKVFGPARCGKSFLMNLLCGHKDLFDVAHGNRPCTQVGGGRGRQEAVQIGRAHV